MGFKFLYCLIGIICLTLSLSLQSEQGKILILIDNESQRIAHADFFDVLKEQDYSIEIQNIKSVSLKLKDYDEYLYSHIIVLGTSMNQQQLGIETKSFIEAFKNGINIIFVNDIDTSKSFRILLNNFGVQLDPIGSQLYDHINAISSSADHSAFYTNNYIKSKPFVDLKISKPLCYKGVAMHLTEVENYQVFSLAQASPYTFSKQFDDKQQTNDKVGLDNSLVVAVQGRNNARFVSIGSLEMLANQFMGDTSSCGNRQFVKALINWTFQKTGQLRVGKVYHHHQNDPSYMPYDYKVKDFTKYSIELEEFDRANKEWIPYIADDLQLEFFMLDPYYRVNLTKESEIESSKYIAEFQIPDKMGVYQFIVDYKKPGYTFIHSATKITVRPFKHDEFPRFLFRAIPYYIGVFGTLIGFLIFFVYYLLDGQLIKKEQFKK